MTVLHHASSASPAWTNWQPNSPGRVYNALQHAPLQPHREKPKKFINALNPLLSPQHLLRRGRRIPQSPQSNWIRNFPGWICWKKPWRTWEPSSPKTAKKTQHCHWMNFKKSFNSTCRASKACFANISKTTKPHTSSSDPTAGYCSTCSPTANGPSIKAPGR